MFLLVAACAGLKAAPVTGVLTDPDMKPVAGAKVYSFLYNREEEPSYTPKIEASTVTDAEGKYSLGELPDLTKDQCRHTVTYLPGKYIGWTSESPAMAELERVIGKPRPLMAMPTVSRTGHVVDQDGRPVANVPVKYLGFVLKGKYPLFLRGEILNILGIPTDLTSDGNGAYTITDAEVDTDILVVPGKKGFASKNASVNQSDLKIVLVPSGRIAGQVKDADGKPLQGVYVTANRENSCPDSATTNANGRFVLEDVAPGTWVVLPNASGRIFVGVQNVKVKTAQTTQVPAILALRMAGVKGKVVYADGGKPAEGVRLAISPSIEYSGNAYTTTGENACITTDASGAFKADAAVGKNSLIVIEPPTGYVTEKPYNEIIVPKTGLSGVTIRLIKATVGKGHVVDETGQPVEGASVSFDTYGSSDAQTGADGSFTVTLPRPYYHGGASYYDEDSYTLYVKQEERNLGAIAQLSRNDILQNDVVINVEPIISAKVHVTLPSGKPAAGAKLYLTTKFASTTSYSSYISSSSGSSMDTRTDANGNANIEELLPGPRYSITVSMPGYYDAGKRPWITSGTTTPSVIEIKLQSATRVQKGKVIDQKGKPVPGAEVSAEGPGMEPIASTKTDATGNFTLRGLPDSSIRLSANKNNLYGSMSVSKSSGTIVLQIVRQDY